MKDVALWFASDPARYRSLALQALGLVTAVALAGALSARIDRRLATRAGTFAFLLLAMLAIFAGRWPTFFAKDTLNEDEAQALAQAITALHFPAPWLGFDGNTCGPLNTYVLDLAVLVHAPLTFFSARVIAVLLEFGAVAAGYCALALLAGTRVARLATLGPIAFFAFAVEPHYVHYAGETLSLFLASMGTASIAWLARTRRPAIVAFVAGVFIGALPFAKLQSVPIAGALGGLALVVGVMRLGSTRERYGRMAALVLGGSALGAILLGWAAVAGSLHDFWLSYIASALGYILPVEEPLGFLTASQEFGPYFDCAVVFIAAGIAALAFARPRRLTPTGYAFVGAVFVLAATIDAIFAPRRGSLNYLLFAVVPAGTAAGAGLATFVETVRQSRLVPVARIVFAGAMLSFAPLASAVGWYPYLGSVADMYAAQPDPITAMIARSVAPGQRMAVWGWRPQYLVYTQTIMGTRDSISHYQQTEVYNPKIAYFRSRYIADMMANRPKAFLDAGPESFDLGNHVADGHEEFPELGALIARDYRLADRYRNFRLYVRK